MVAAARAGRRFESAPRVEIEEMILEDGVDKLEVVQAGSPFAVGGGPGDGDRPSPAGLFPEQAKIVSLFPKGGRLWGGCQSQRSG